VAHSNPAQYSPNKGGGEVAYSTVEGGQEVKEGNLQKDKEQKANSIAHQETRKGLPEPAGGNEIANRAESGR